MTKNKISKSILKDIKQIKSMNETIDELESLPSERIKEKDNKSNLVRDAEETEDFIASLKEWYPEPDAEAAWLEYCEEMREAEMKE